MIRAEAFELLGISEDDPPERIWPKLKLPFWLTFAEEKTIRAHVKAVRVVCDSRPDLEHRLVEIGALPVIYGMAGLEPRVLDEARSFVSGDGAASAIADRLSELGRGDLLTRNPAELFCPLDHVEHALCEALGVDLATHALPLARPREAARMGRLRNEAWFLSVYVHLSREVEVNRDVRAAVELGQLLQWWRWRRFGLDRAAKMRGKQTQALADASQARDKRNADRREASLAWRVKACRLAFEIWARRPGLSVAAVAQEIRANFIKNEIVSADGTTPGDRSIRGAIKPLKPKMT